MHHRSGGSPIHASGVRSGDGAISEFDTILSPFAQNVDTWAVLTEKSLSTTFFHKTIETDASTAIRRRTMIGTKLADMQCKTKLHLK